jgi:hypothetical protein
MNLKGTENNFEEHKEKITTMLNTLLKENEDTKILECYEILLKLFQQIGKIPNERKYRIFNKNNSVLSRICVTKRLGGI